MPCSEKSCVEEERSANRTWASWFVTLILQLLFRGFDVYLGPTRPRRRKVYQLDRRFTRLLTISRPHFQSTRKVGWKMLLLRSYGRIVATYIGQPNWPSCLRATTFLERKTLKCLSILMVSFLYMFPFFHNSSLHSTIQSVACCVKGDGDKSRKYKKQL